MYPAGDVGVVEGEMNIPTRGVPSGDSMEFNTLDEPIKETFVSKIWQKKDYLNSINSFHFKIPKLRSLDMKTYIFLELFFNIFYLIG